jgi:hypothetical protein
MDSIEWTHSVITRQMRESSTVAGLSRKEIVRIVEHIEPQGVKITRTKKGLLLRLPNQDTAMIHFTGSDHRGGAALRADLRRAGITWPFDEVKTLPKSITEAKIWPKTLEAARANLIAAGSPQKLRIRDATRIFYPDRGEQQLTGYYQDTAKRLYALGWRPSPGKQTYRVWYQPVDQDPEPTWLEPEPEQAPEPEPEPAEPVREFIDSADSWCIDPGSLGTMPLRDAFNAWKAAGLNAEIRVWREQAA